MSNNSLEVLTVSELASTLKIGKSRAYELVNQKDFPSFRIGKNIRVSKADLEDWMSKYK